MGRPYSRSNSSQEWIPVLPYTYKMIFALCIALALHALLLRRFCVKRND